MGNEISVRARGAAESFRHGCEFEQLVDNWKNSAEVYFDEFIKAVYDSGNPIPQGYFESGYGLSSNPILGILEPKSLICVLESSGLREPSVLDRLERDVFKPYVAAWERLVKALVIRCPAAFSTVQAFASKLQAILGAVRMMATLDGSARTENFERTYNLYNDLCGAFREAGVVVAFECSDLTGCRNGSVSDAPVNDRMLDEYKLRCLAKKVKSDLHCRSIRAAVDQIFNATPDDKLYEECRQMIDICRRRGWSESTVQRLAKPSSARRHVKGILTPQGLARERNKGHLAEELRDCLGDDMRAVQISTNRYR